MRDPHTKKMISQESFGEDLSSGLVLINVVILDYFTVI